MMGNNDGNNDARQYYADVERENASLRRVVVTLEDEVAQLRQVAKDLYDWCPACLGCHPSQEWMCPICKHRKLIDGWEASDA